MNWKVHFSSVTDRWATPREVYSNLDKEFHFTFQSLPARRLRGWTFALSVVGWETGVL